MPSDGSTQDTSTWPLPAFYFKVVIGAFGLLGADSSFQEVSGIGGQLETEDIMEGGDNDRVYHLPKGQKLSNLVLKRGIASITSPLVLWCTATFSSNLSLLTTQTVLVSLLGEDGMPLRVWSFTNAYPVNWKVDAFTSTKNEVAIEEIELCYSGLTRLL